jgi:carbon monoxide dehydrogenase subunit G
MSLAWILGLALAGFSAGAGAVEFHTLEVSRQGDIYQVQAEVYLAAPPQAVFAVLTDYDHFTRISASVVESRKVQQLDPATTLVYTDTKVCALFYCRHVKELQRITETPPAEVASVVLPEKSDNVKSGSALLHVQAEGEGTLLRWQLSLEPGFWVPPLIGPPLLERSLKAEGRRSAAGVEKLARERAHLPPLNGTENHDKTQDPGKGGASGG